MGLLVERLGEAADPSRHGEALCRLRDSGSRHSRAFRFGHGVYWRPPDAPWVAHALYLGANDGDHGRRHRVREMGRRRFARDIAWLRGSFLFRHVCMAWNRGAWSCVPIDEACGERLTSLVV
jgi:hypothetical protein